MKLLVCVKCNDVFSVRTAEEKSCSCGLSKGQYKADGLHANYSGPCFPVGFSNPSFISAIRNQPDRGLGVRFEAFVIPKDCPTFVKTDEPYEIKIQTQDDIDVETTTAFLTSILRPHEHTS